jgi:GMP synthase-like glutamine amidotransferase
MRVVTLRHHAEDDPGFIGASLSERGATLTTIDVATGGRLPDPAAADGVVVLGATWSVMDRASMGWMIDELAWLGQVDRVGVPILGICFGAQALSVALGGDVERSPRVEIGWTTIEPASAEDFDAGPWFEFHEDRCLPPEQAEILARNEVAVQAFRIGRHLAVQFHPEVDGAQLRGWIEHGAAEAVGAVGIDAEALIAETIAEEPNARRRADRLVDRWLG